MVDNLHKEKIILGPF